MLQTVRTQNKHWSPYRPIQIWQNSYCKQEALSSESGYGGEITETRTTEF